MPGDRFFRSLSRQQWQLVCVVVLANLCCAVTFSCIVPYFPDEAKLKGLTTTQIGFLIGAPQLSIAFASPVFGKSLSYLGPNRLFSGGLALCALGVISFGAIPLVNGGNTFFWTVLLLRVFISLGWSAYNTSSTALLACSFPDQLASTMGILSTFGSVSYSLGPIVGASLFHVGGFSLPFWTFGAMMLLSSLASVPLLSVGPSSSSAPPTPTNERGAGLMDVLRVPQIGLVLLGLFTFQWCGSFSDSTLADHLSVLHRSHMFPSLMISLCAFVAETITLPEEFVALLHRSCLSATVNSHLMNDSVLDISKHVIVFESVISIVDALANSPPIYNSGSALSRSQSGATNAGSVRCSVNKLKTG